MYLSDPIQLTQEFVLRAKDRIRKEQEVVQNRDRHQRQNQKAKDAQDDLDDLMQIVVVATANDIAHFQSKLDDYEQQAVQRILILQQERDQKLAERDAMLDDAYKLPDGKHVFVKDKDTVVDETGGTISPDIITPEQIGGDYPNWDQFSKIEKDIESIDQSLSEAITFRDKIEDLRIRSDAEGLTQDELDALELELEDIMPENFKPDDHTLNSKIDEVIVAPILIEPMGIGNK